MMRIVFLSRYQNSIQRGAETFVRELSKHLSLRHDINILTEEKSDSLKEILKGDYQIIVAMNGGKQSLIASLGRLRKNYRLVISGQAGVGRGEIFNIAVARPDLYVALTETMFKWAKNWAWGSKVVKIPNGVDLRKFSLVGEKRKLDLEKPIILSVGALVDYKHHERSIIAVSKLDKGSLLIVGEGEEENRLQVLGNRLLESRFKILHASYQDLPKIYRSCNLFVLPSWSREAFGIVYLEAMASGLGIVAPDDLSRREIIGNAGIFVDVLDNNKYKEGIEQALKIDWEYKALTQARQFSWDKIGKQYEEEFEKILK